MSLEKKVAIIFFILLFAFPVYFKFIYDRSQAQNKPKVVLPREEVTVTIIPGWTLRDVADYFVKNKFASSSEDVFRITGEPLLLSKNSAIDEGYNYEGYLAPETYRVYRDAKLEEVIDKLLNQRKKEFQDLDFKNQNVHTILTVASLVEKEARSTEDRKMVADIIWRRNQKNWALQLDSTVHYVADKSGTVFTTDQERKIDSPYNTYKYPGFPPGPICTPSLESIEAVLEPEKNNYWYFLSGNDGKMHYAKTLEEHTANRYKYLR